MKNLNILRFLGKYPNPIAQKASYDSSNSYADKDSKYNKLNTTYNHNYRGYDVEE